MFQFTKKLNSYRSLEKLHCWKYKHQFGIVSHSCRTGLLITCLILDRTCTMAYPERTTSEHSQAVWRRAWVHLHGSRWRWGEITFDLAEAWLVKCFWENMYGRSKHLHGQDTFECLFGCILNILWIEPLLFDNVLL